MWKVHQEDPQRQITTLKLNKCADKLAHHIIIERDSRVTLVRVDDDPCSISGVRHAIILLEASHHHPSAGGLDRAGTP
jgi:hypothetical protein